MITRSMATRLASLIPRVSPEVVRDAYYELGRGLLYDMKRGRVRFLIDLEVALLCNGARDDVVSVFDRGYLDTGSSTTMANSSPA